MKEEISDNEFDRLFKEKSHNFDYQFEEEAWDLMEKKLRKRDRIVYIQRFSAAALILLFWGMGLYLFNSDSKPAKSNIVLKPQQRDSSSIIETSKEKVQTADKTDIDKIKTTSSSGIASALPKAENKSIAVSHPEKTGLRAGTQQSGASLAKTSAQKKPKSSSDITVKSDQFISASANDKNPAQTKNTSNLAEKETIAGSLIPDSLDYLASVPLYSDPQRDSINVAPSVNQNELSGRLQEIAILKSKPKFSFTLAAGPDYSSIQSLKGRQGNLNVGLLLNMSYKKFILSTGAKYGLKKYSAGAFDYALNNPTNAYNISEINAACNVLEIPTQLSYTAFQFNNQRIDVSGGLSSYLMLRENYQFCYKPETGRPDYYLQKNNANRSYFGVMSLSASYKFKPIKQNILVGIEPYAKLPLGGVGEGKVKLKSSGIALTMTYELIKRN